MFYETRKNDHGLPHDPFSAIIAPRPIGWIGTKGQDGSFNLAPYSFFNALSYRPKLVMFSSAGRSIFYFWTWRADRFFKALD